MYVTTFYSFKGGVGRTMALVNVAVELARRGRRVVAVDFDLEAPGLDTFDLGRPGDKTPGLLDFVETFLATDRAPDARDFLFESSFKDENGGRLWVMPSGAQDHDYSRRLAALDWQDLYDHHDGFLLFEDLREQWRQLLEADYVLIDSRTGYTDVGGICTRQLPDAVVLLFFPNRQNLRGLTKIARDIRNEPTRSEEDAIDLHYVLSNVPDLDDEDEILQGITADFQKQLGFRREPLAIHRYPSLSLLKQDIFTKERPRSRLAREYQALAAEVIRQNPADREGALDYIRRSRGPWHARAPGDDGRKERYLKQIEQHHAEDGEVLLRLARLRDRQGRLDDSAELFSRAIEVGYGKPEAYLERARHRRWYLDDPAGASEDALEVLRTAEAAFPEVIRALRLLAPDDLDRVSACPAIKALAPCERIRVGSLLTRTTKEAELARALLQPALTSASLEPQDRASARQAAILALLALGRFQEAAGACSDGASSVDTMTVQDAFNYGMAVWAQQREPPRAPFARVVALDASESASVPNANYAQCLAMAHWVVGDASAGKEALVAAESRSARERSSFSCWRYLEVPARVFTEDLREMRQMIDSDETVLPRFMRRQQISKQASSPTDESSPQERDEAEA